MALGDAGYGTVMALLSLAGLRFLRLSDSGRNFLQLLLICAVSTIIYGAYSKAWFGNLIFPDYDFVGGFITVMIVSLALGVVHLIYAIMVELYDNARHGDRAAAILDQGSWLLFIAGTLLFSLSRALSLPAAVGVAGNYLFAFGALASIYSMGRMQKNIPARLVVGLGTFYMSVTGFLGDVLSYLRLLALGLATGGIAVVVNQIARLFRDIPYVGLLLMILIMAVGHIKIYAYTEHHAVDDGDVKSYIERLKACYKVDEEIDQLKFFAAAKASIGIAALAKDMDLDALVLNDIDSQLHKKVGLRPGFYHESFNERGSVLVPEGDVGTALACLALKIMTGKHIGFIEPFYIDAPHNRFCAGHAGPFDHTDERFRENVVIAPDARYEKAPYKFAGAPFAWHRIPPGPMTMAHFSECKGDYKVICTIVDSLPGRHIIKGYSHSVFEPRVKVEKLFEDIIEAGAHQHFALVEGDALSELKEWAYINNFDYHYIAEEK
jgi:hypothetical protein